MPCAVPPEPDPLGKMALYSGAGEARPPAYGTFLVECSSCKRETPVAPLKFVPNAARHGSMVYRTDENSREFCAARQTPC